MKKRFINDWLKYSTTKPNKNFLVPAFQKKEQAKILDYCRKSSNKSRGAYLKVFRFENDRKNGTRNCEFMDKINQNW